MMAWTWIWFLSLTAFQPASKADQAGPYAVASTTTTYVDESRDSRRLVTEIWYPVEQENEGGENPSASGKTAGGKTAGRMRNARCAQGPFPVILFSHGSQAVRTQSSELCEHWASHGYVVVAPDHQYNTFLDHQRERNLQTALDRPADISWILDRVEERCRTSGDLLEGRLLLDQIAAIGHSFGGYTSLVLGGAVVDFEQVAQQFKAQIPEPIPTMTDPRILAVVAYAPVGPPLFNSEGLKSLMVPTLVFGSTLDTAVPYETSQVPIYEHAGGTCYLAGLLGGSHYSYNNTVFYKMIQKARPDDTREDIDRDTADRLIRGVTLAFLDRHVTERDRWSDWLVAHPPYLEFRSRVAN